MQVVSVLLAIDAAVASLIGVCFAALVALVGTLAGVRVQRQMNKVGNENEATKTAIEGLVQLSEQRGAEITRLNVRDDQRRSEVSRLAASLAEVQEAQRVCEEDRAEKDLRLQEALRENERLLLLLRDEGKNP